MRKLKGKGRCACARRLFLQKAQKVWMAGENMLKYCPRAKPARRAHERRKNFPRPARGAARGVSAYCSGAGGLSVLGHGIWHPGCQQGALPACDSAYEPAHLFRLHAVCGRQPVDGSVRPCRGVFGDACGQCALSFLWHRHAGGIPRHGRCTVLSDLWNDR